MDKLFKISLIWLLILSAGIGIAQPPSWNFTPTSVNHTIFIKNDASILINGEMGIEIGDAIGVFYTTDVGERCAGFTIWNGDNTFITAYGKDAFNPGFINGDAFIFKVWKSGLNCEVNDVDAIFGNGLLNAGQFAENGISEVISLEGRFNTFSYPNIIYCKSDANPSPIIDGSLGVIYSSQPGLIINPSAGEIDLENSTAGTYTIIIQSGLCFESYEFELTINQAINLDNIVVEIENEYCIKKGSLTIDYESISGGKPPYSIELLDLENGQGIVFPVGGNSLEDLSEGLYNLIVTDAIGCTATLDRKIEINKTEKFCQLPIITPNNDNQSESIYVPYQGMVKVYNRYGQLIKKLDAPTEWDATNQNGGFVPMGVYVLVSGSKSFQVTVVR